MQMNASLIYRRRDGAVSVCFALRVVVILSPNSAAVILRRDMLSSRRSVQHTNPAAMAFVRGCSRHGRPEASASCNGSQSANIARRHGSPSTGLQDQPQSRLHALSPVPASTMMVLSAIPFAVNVDLDRSAYHDIRQIQRAHKVQLSWTMY